MAFDSTHLLQQASTACSTMFLLVLPIRIWKLRNVSIRSDASWQRRFKGAIGALLSVLFLLYWREAPNSIVPHEAAFSASLLVSVLADIGLSLLLLREPKRSYSTPDLATMYLVVSILCDATYITMSSYSFGHAIILRPVLFRCCTHLALLILEYLGNYEELDFPKRDQSPEEFCGFLSRALYIWINPIILQGYKGVLAQQDLPPLSREMTAGFTRTAMLHAWSQRAKPETKYALPLALLKCLKKPFSAAIIPRLFLIVGRYSQPILIKQSIEYVTTYSENTDESLQFWLIVSALIIYIGLALSKAMYEHRINKLKLMTRSALLGLIHDKTLKSPSITYDNGEATTLMSTDVDSLDGIGEMVHETWAQVIEVLIGMIFLANQVRWLWPLPLFLIYLCSYMSRFVAKHLQPRQRAWNDATQDRIAATSSMFSAMKVVKMLGIQHNLANRIRELRKEELWAASKLRWITVYYNASANALGIFSPAITLVSFAIMSMINGERLESGTAFTTMAILSMVTHPANMVMTIIPRAVAALAGFERIQSFLLREAPKHHREILSRSTSSISSSEFKLSPAVKISRLQIGYGEHVLKDVNLELAAGSFTIISGPTGSGKSTLLRAILGEALPSHGSISLSTQDIAYCAQKPWLPRGTIREVIRGASDQHYEGWYQEVTSTCCLTHDFDSLPDGDQTQVGSRGLNLSGGQRLRVTLARALYARCEIIILDDTFSGLDGETEQTIFQNLFRSTGLLRRLSTTVILVSNSSQYFQFADHIVVLGDHGVVDQGHWQNIKIKAASIEKFTVGHYSHDNALLTTSFEKLSANLQARDEIEADLARRSGDPALYGYYLSFINPMSIFLLIGCTASYAFFITFPQYWLQLWTEVGGRSTAFYVYGFLFLSFMSWISTSTQMWSVVVRIAPQSGFRLHQHLLQIVTRAPLSYFSETENGSILNRFSQDIQVIDKKLPSALQSVLIQIFKLLMQIMTLCMAERWLSMSLPACALFVFIVQRVYLRTSRQLRLMELETRADVFSSFLETIEGLESIRSFGWSETVIQKNQLSVNNSQRPGFLLLCLQGWLNIVLDLLAAAVATIAVAIAVSFRGYVSGAQVGIALNIMLVANTTLLKLVENWTTLETSLGAIARLKTLEQKTPVEGGNLMNMEPPKNWPSKGNIRFESITASYQSISAALRDVSLIVNAGQRLIICGRTGSGKSTLILTLLRLLELQSGKIEIDGIDIKLVGLDLLRQRCFVVVSQDALLLPNETLRFNLDPDSSMSDDILAGALERTGLWPHFSGLDSHACENTAASTANVINIAGYGEHRVLDQKVSLFRDLSVGQCQLFGLCRAIIKISALRRSGIKPIILLDEVTSSLDTTTESVINRIIDDELTEKGHTVVMVAHRLGTLKKLAENGRDVVALMEDGRLREIIADSEPL